MTNTKSGLCISCRRKLSILMVVIGSLLVILGIGLFALQNRPSPDAKITMEEDRTTEPTISETEVMTTSDPAVIEEDHEESLVENSQSVTEATPPIETVTEVADTEIETTYFNGPLEQWTVAHYSLTDNQALIAEEVPDFHGVTTIVAEEGTNLKTGKPSQNLVIHLAAVPDRLFTVAVLVTELQEGTVMESPESVIGEQWLLSYVDGDFIKTARVVSDNGTIEPRDAEAFNLRFAGNEDSPEIIFYGPLETKYYGLMVVDEGYFTLIVPK